MPLDHRIVVHDLDAILATADRGARRQSDEGESPEALASLNRLQQEGVLALPRFVELAVHRQGRFKIRKANADQGYPVKPLRRERPEFELRHQRVPAHRAARSCARRLQGSSIRWAKASTSLTRPSQSSSRGSRPSL